MNYLFVLDNLRDNCGATVNIAITIAKRFVANSHNVYAVTHQQRKLCISEKNRSVFKEVFLVNPTEEDKEYFYQKKEWNSLGNLGKVVFLISHPHVLKCYLLNRDRNEKYYKRKYIKKIENICGELQIDAVFSFSCPHYLEEVIALSEIDSTKIIYQLDPYIHHQMMGQDGIEKRKAKEMRIFSRVDKVFTTPIIYEEYASCLDNEYMKKIIPVEFPGIKIQSSNNYETVQHTKDENIHFYFVGYLYSNIRDPGFTFNLFNKLPSNFIFHVVGGGSEDIINDYSVILKDRLKLHGSVSNAEAEEIINSADVLVNINNTVSNQVPSKIFDYINTGKPIINICKLYDCPSLPYMNRYPLCLNIFEQDGITEDLINDFKEFTDQSVGKVVPHEEILKRYYDCTDEYVAGKVLSAIRKGI